MTGDDAVKRTGARRGVGAIAACLGLVLVGCNGASPTGTTGAPGTGAGTGAGAGASGTAGGREAGPRLLFVSNSNSDWWSAVEKGMQDGGSAFGAPVELRRNNEGTAGQIRLLEDALSLPDVKGVAVSVIEAEAPGVADAMRALQQAGKVVITIDSDIAPGAAEARSAYIGTNNRKAGEAAGRAAAMLRPQGGKVVIFVGTSGAANAIERREGFFQGAGEKFTQVEVFDDSSDPNRAQSNVQTAITKYPDIGVLLGLWSYNAPLIAEEVGNSPKVRAQATVVTFDLDQRAVSYLDRKLIDVTVCQNPYEMGYQGVRLLKALVEKDQATVKEVLPDGQTRDTGVRVIVPSADSPVKGDNVLTIDQMKTWLDGKGLRSS
jgi:ribose transport system substrate-binding protein